jgi:hypothetical protein
MTRCQRHFLLKINFIIFYNKIINKNKNENKLYKNIFKDILQNFNLLKNKILKIELQQI